MGASEEERQAREGAEKEESEKIIMGVDMGSFGPVGLLPGANGSLYCASYQTNEVIHFVRDFDSGRYRYVGVYASGGGLHGPSGLDMDDKNKLLYVTSYENNQLIAFNTTSGKAYSQITGRS